MYTHDAETMTPAQDPKQGNIGNQEVAELAVDIGILEIGNILRMEIGRMAGTFGK